MCSKAYNGSIFTLFQYLENPRAVTVILSNPSALSDSTKTLLLLMNELVTYLFPRSVSGVK